MPKDGAAQIGKTLPSPLTSTRCGAHAKTSWDYPEQVFLEVPRNGMQLSPCCNAASTLTWSAWTLISSGVISTWLSLARFYRCHQCGIHATRLCLRALLTMPTPAAQASSAFRSARTLGAQARVPPVRRWATRVGRVLHRQSSGHTIFLCRTHLGPNAKRRRSSTDTLASIWSPLILETTGRPGYHAQISPETCTAQLRAVTT